MEDRQHVGIVGAGIVGLAHALAAAKQGHRVTVFERNAACQGASIRNFGMVWPVGQEAGPALDAALRSREIWLELAGQANFFCRPTGAIYLAHREDEWQVLNEFADQAVDLGYQVELLSPDQVRRKTPAANPNGLLGGLFSRTELAVDPVQAIAALPGFLNARYGVQFHFECPVVAVRSGGLTTSDRREWTLDQIIVCSGVDFHSLLPTVFQRSGLRACKLQMMRTIPQPSEWNLGTHIASGLTLRHYNSFRICPSLSRLVDRVAEETPELDRYGIHVMASQNAAGEIILGDSHEYDTEIGPFDRPEIDALILRELHKIIELPTWEVSRRWSGIYAKHPTQVIYRSEPIQGVHVATGTGGGGMTLAFGLADAFVAGGPLCSVAS
ncbi:D-amino acid dehydrogenase small subunit [Crateriforma conspicua]|uniref:D-amino acid dehydrogenase small subunit n=1 Tax=Crateriforma conspicua TaxID=2527996 RepID=A0A5C6FU85_9PLAN|nr:TIGR03364 family FAD-dependent oxidoreductase [Crateriforma conspicua]TWU65038.1 D-amino acid dehydrogenase small subunit [Crateriforma conspicua]